MEYKTTYRFRIYPDKTQIKTIDDILYLSHILYNDMLEQRKMAYELNKDFYENIKITSYTQEEEFPGIKNEFPEYKNIYSQALQNVADRLDKSYDNFFRRIKEKKNGKKIKTGFPRFKSREQYRSITYTQSGFKLLDNTHIFFSKIGEIRGKIKQGTIKKHKADNYFVTLVVEAINNINCSEFPYNPV